MSPTPGGPLRPANAPRSSLQTNRRRGWLLLEAVALHALMRAALAALSFPRVRRLVAVLSSRTRGPSRRAEVLWAVEGSRRLVPFNTCLSTALAGSVMCARRRLRTRLRIGVARVDGKMEAHAWVEGDHGEVLLGKLDDLERYVPLSTQPGGFLS